MNLRYTLSFLRMMRIPGLYPIMRDMQAFIRMHFIFAAYESGLLQALASPCKKEILMEKLQVKRPELLDALLEVGLATGELAKKNGRFCIKGKRARAIMGNDGDMLAAMIQANATYYSDAYRNANYRMYGSNLSEDLDKIGDLVARYSRITEPIVRDFLAVLVRGKRPMRVLDVGCGSGSLLRSVYDANGNATGVGLDVDETVVREARNNISAWGLAEQFDIRHGDILSFSGENLGPFDLITLVNILYYFNKEERAGLINKLRTMQSPKGMLAVAMMFHSKGRDIAAANLNMVNCSMKGLTPLPVLDDITSLLKQCGYGRISIHRFMPGSTFYGIVAYNS